MYVLQTYNSFLREWNKLPNDLKNLPSLKHFFWLFVEEAKKLTDQAKGKHHIGDFLPPDELKRFIAKVKAVKGEKGLEDIDLSDYAEFKLTEENVGYQMLKKAGWTEGSGLGSKGQGITAPINK